METFGSVKGEFRVQHKLGSNERALNFQKNEPSLSNANWFLRYRGSKSKHGRRHFLDVKPHFRLNEDQYDVTVALLKQWKIKSLI